MTMSDTKDPTVRRRTRPLFTRVQVVGLGLVSATLVAVLAVMAVTEPGSVVESLAFFGPVIAVTAATAWLAWRFGTWARVLGVVVGVLTGLLLFWTAFGLSSPDSLLDFALGVGVPLGIVVAIGGGVAAILSGRRGRVAAAATTAERRVVSAVAAIVGVALLASAGVTMAGRTSVDAALVEGATTVEMADFEFSPAEIAVDSADGRIVVTNTDPFLHDLAVPALDAAVRVTPGSSALLDVSGAAPGTYTAYCTLHSDTSEDDPAEAGMAALLVVR